MVRRDRQRRRRAAGDRPHRGLTSAFRRPGAQIGVLLVAALVVFFLLQQAGRQASGTLPDGVGLAEAHQMYQEGALLLDVRMVEEWNEFHVPQSMLIPLEQLSSRLSEVPRDRQIVVVCRSGNCSQQGRDLLRGAGFAQVTSLTAGLADWRGQGFPTEP